VSPAPPLSSNGVLLPREPKYVGLMRDTQMADVPTGEAHARLWGDGYVLLRNALPADLILQLREAYFKLFPSSFVAAGDAKAGAFSGQLPLGLPRHGTTGHPAHAFVRSGLFKELVNLPELKKLAESLLDAPAHLIRRTPLRHFIKGQPIASRAHLDGTYLNGPSDACVTFWVPLGACPVEAGSLAYLEGSHGDPAAFESLRTSAPTDRPNDARPLTHDLRWLSDQTGARWLTADFAAGDIVAHTPDIVHASLDPQIDMMRLSTDIRFQKDGTPMDPRWLDDWSADDGY
jgi:hypothetical protein